MKVLSRVFRGKFLDGLKRLHRDGELRLVGPMKMLTEEKPFRQFLRTLYRQDWVVYAKAPFGGPLHVLHYLASWNDASLPPCPLCGGPMALVERLTALDLARESSRRAAADSS